MVESGSASDLATRSRCLPWQGKTWGRVLRMLENERLPHALLLEGVPGTGRGQFAEALARHLLCAAPTAEGNCGQCKACTLSATGAHADFHRMAPEEPGKAIGIDAVRAAIRFATGTASFGARKVMLVSPAQSMTSAAFNAFLKCLEEPSPGTFILLVSARGYPIPATILSRCQRLPMSSPTSDESRSWLLETLGSRANASAEIDAMLVLSADRPLDALQRFEDGASEALIAAYASLQALMARESGARQRAEASIDKLPAEEALALVEQALRRWLLQQDAGGLRATAGLRAFQALTELDRLRSAHRSGSNPNVDLLRFSAVQAAAGLWTE